MNKILHTLIGSARDLLPIVLVVGFFQLVVLGQPLPNVDTIFIGLALVILGLTLFVYGLELALFPIITVMGYAQLTLWLQQRDHR